ncbi:MAG: aspartate aminotransferase family protein [Nocardiopsaceae bacterium]|jgi:glutamate-1-semialdehyde 2,1-aminomutase|nr:aspartate aminotransferase family protein [Nocardiopsaceae bacterium]
MADNQAVQTETVPQEAGAGANARPAEPQGHNTPTADAAPPSPGPDLDGIIAEQERIFVERQPESARLAAEAREALAGGVTSSWQISRPQPVWLSHGSGSKLYDVDGNDYVDLHGGYGVSLAGHGHPAIVAAVKNQVTRGTHFAQPTHDALTVARELTKRFGLPQWRFGNSGTEATMDAVHLMRAIKGRDLIIKVEGCYHGHHDSVQVSVYPDAAEIGPAERPASVPASAGIPRSLTDLTVIVGFNDLAAVERVLRDYSGQVAGMLLEPIMMNAGVILPEPGYLAGLKELLHAHDALLAFDEVKTGLTAGPGGATGLTGVTPDIISLAKAIGGGISVAAVGGTHEVMQHVANGDYEQVGTFNGNPLAMAATRAMLQEVATPEAYQRIDTLREQAVHGVNEAIKRHGLAASVVAVGAKGCITFSPEPVRDFRDFLTIDDAYSHAHWLFQHNGGVFLPPWGKSEQWLISVQHDQGDIDRFNRNVMRFASSIG